MEENVSHLDLEAFLKDVGNNILEHYKLTDVKKKPDNEFNVFRLCGIAHYELWHSRILADFLNPYGSHGLGSAFLKAFFDGCNVDWNVENARVYTEFSFKIGDETLGRLDILIEGQDYGIIIENKLFAVEQPGQLTRYYNWLKSRYEKHLLIFLTPNGQRSVTARDDCEYRSISYVPVGKTFNVCSWLDECQRIAVNAPFVKDALAQYSAHIQNVVKGGINETVCGAIADNPFAAKLVFENYRDSMHREANSLFLRISEKLGVRLEEGLSYNHREQGYLIKKEMCGMELKVFFGFEETGFRGCFMGVRFEDLPDRLRSINDWPDRVKRLGNMFDSNKFWVVWKYITIKIDEECFSDWDGRFFQMIKDSSDGEDVVSGIVTTCFNDVCMLVCNQTDNAG